MLKDFVGATYHTVDEYDVSFDDGHNNGFGFPCDASGKLLDGLTKEAKVNYEWCLQHPERFERFNKVVKHVRRVKDAAHGKCKCGNDVELWNEYDGACQCQKCGQWYNLFGQELLPPEQWEE
jgi:hypothetical protein